MCTSTGVFLMIEIAKVLKKNGDLTLFFINNTPSQIKQTITQLGEETEDIENSILRALFNLNDAEVRIRY